MSCEFSVIIPTYRRLKELAQALSSAIGQSGARVEAIVIDDSPEGSAREVVYSFRNEAVTYVQNPKPSGGIPSIVRNLGWPHAKGTFVHFLDDDDIVPERHYEAVKKAFSDHPDVGIVFGRVEPFGTCSHEQLQSERVYFTDAARSAARCQKFGPRFAFAARMLFGNALLVSSASVLRRECVEKLHGFDPGIRLMEDADFHVRAIREFGAYFTDRTCVHYRIGSPSLMHSPHPDERQVRDQREGRRKMQSKYRKRYGLLEFCALAGFDRTVLRIG